MRRPELAGIVAAAVLVTACGAEESAERAAVVGDFTADTARPGLQYLQRDSVYAVGGASAAEVGAAMAAQGPSGDGTPYFGSTRWALRWRWQPELTPFGCRLAYPTVRLETTMTLPAWSAPPGASPELVERWAEFLPALRAHEDGHRDLAIGMAQETLIALDGLSAATCERVGEVAERAAARVRERWDARQEAYERDLRNTPAAARWPER